MTNDSGNSFFNHQVDVDLILAISNSNCSKVISAWLRSLPLPLSDLDLDIESVDFLPGTDPTDAPVDVCIKGGTSVSALFGGSPTGIEGGGGPAPGTGGGGTLPWIGGGGTLPGIGGGALLG